MKASTALAVIAVAAAAILALAAPAGAATQVKVAGTVAGDWWSGGLYSTAPVAATFELRSFIESSGVYLGSGTELFTGCLDVPGPDPCGTLTFEYQAWGNLDHDGVFVKGGCQHWIVDSGGGLAGATGFISMQDRPDTTYKGQVSL
jgi:hypothetical protein